MDTKYLNFKSAVYNIFQEIISEDAAFYSLCFKLKDFFSHSNYTCVRIKIDEKEYTTNNFEETRWILKEPFKINDNKSASIDVFYSKEFPIADEGAFLKTERELLIWLKSIIVSYLGNNNQANYSFKPQIYEDDKKFLPNFLSDNKYDREIYHDLMVYKVKEILLIATLYDAYSIEREGNFTHQILGDYINLDLTSFPRFTAVNSYAEAQSKLKNKHFDLVIIMVGIDKKIALNRIKKIKKEFPYLPAFLLLNNNTDISLFEKINEKDKYIDNIFVWNGDSRIFFTIVKLLEDRINLDNDVKIGHIRIILLVEDSAKYYSRYLPLLYHSVMRQTQRIIEDLSVDDAISRILSLRLRPKILLVSNYEAAKNIFDKYRNNFLSLITDVEFFKNGKIYKNAGFELANYVKNSNPTQDIPVIIQSSNQEYRERAYSQDCSFIDKNSQTLALDIKGIVKYNMGFGDFIYYDKNGNQLDFVARNIKEFENNLNLLPDNSLVYHAMRNHFSLWLKARGEQRVAEILSPLQTDDFPDAKSIRSFLVNAVSRNNYEKRKGKIIDFYEDEILDKSNIILLASGALGGKGRGLAFIHKLIYKSNISENFPDINIKTPLTFIIGTNEFDYFLRDNLLRYKVYNDMPYLKVRELFMKARLTKRTRKRLKLVLKYVRKPIAVRSSGLFEDSLMQPFAGIFETYIVPNNHDELKVRFEQLQKAIKLVYASIFADKAKSYISAINYKIEEEKMAIVLQEVVGNEHEGYYYPDVSGVAQSYNYYPFSHIEPEDGFANIALGLGTYVVEGEKSYRFCPKYPSIRNYSPKDLHQNSQLEFYAVNLKSKKLFLSKGENAALKRLTLYDAEQHGSLKHLCSVFNMDSNTIIPGIDKSGPRVVDFANILKYNYIPLANTLIKLLEIGKEAIGTAVEIEFAIDINKDKDYKASFYLLQIKPLIGNTKNYEVDIRNIDASKTIMFTNKGMGNGLIDDISDVIYVDKDTFDKSKTEEISQEIAEFNKKMVNEERKYVLIGPGRWGTRDKWIGIPIEWSQISNAKIIVETSLKGYPLDASLGSHFFHNVISMNVGYFSIQHNKQNHILAWGRLAKQKIIEKTKYVKHIRFEQALKIKMDGKQRVALIST